MKTNSLVTIITPAYNRADLITKTIKSVLSQDYPNIEYIVLDDGSTDETLKIIKKYKRKLIWESHANVGETKTVNLGFKMAKGDIIGVVNSDDPLLPGAVKEIVNTFRNNPKLMVVYPDWKMIDQNGKVTGLIKVPEYNYLNMLRWHYCMPGPGAFFRKSLVRKLGGRDTQFKYVGDFDFWLRAGLVGPFARIPKFLATFRVHPGSASVGKKGNLMAEEHIRLVNKIFSMKDLLPDILRIKNESYSSAYYYAGFLSVGDHWKRKYYYYRSILFSPITIIFKHQKWINNILFEFFPFLSALLILKSKLLKRV